MPCISLTDTFRAVLFTVEGRAYSKNILDFSSQILSSHESVKLMELVVTNSFHKSRFFRISTLTLITSAE